MRGDTIIKFGWSGTSFFLVTLEMPNTFFAIGEAASTKPPEFSELLMTTSIVFNGSSPRSTHSTLA